MKKRKTKKTKATPKRTAKKVKPRTTKHAKRAPVAAPRPRFSFQTMRRNGVRLYRGGSGDVSRAIMSAAVGPIRSAAELIRDETHGQIHPNMHQRVLRVFVRHFCGNVAAVALPHDNLSDNLDMLMQQPRLVPNLYTTFEHVVAEAPINQPFTGKLLESITKKPQVAVLYAYGIRLDPWFINGSIEFYSGQPNATPFVAVLEPQQDPPLAIIYARNIYDEQGFDENEAHRRVQRDEEVLLQQAMRPAAIIDLPPFDVANSARSLNTAAAALRNAGVVA